ncbi:MAG: hypothetical protein Q8L05_02275 [Actinomycetota bacterium]|nr:hypothetical protein [Actinomycetota bacterium]MDP2287795.1 hypothetical protein [Actinomycetota bacterium]
MLPQASAYRVVADSTIRIHVSELACCALEVGSALSLGLLEIESEYAPTARIDVLLVAGTVTELLAPAVEAQWLALPEPRLAIAIGACASSGGPYWAAIPVRKGITDLIETSGYIAGCPPDPGRIVDGVLALVPQR